MARVKLGLATLAAFVAVVAAPPGHASTPIPWCGTPSSVDRQPDATLGYAVHVIYVRPPGSPDRFAEWAPRIAGDAAEIEAWWRGQDPTRSPRFDLFAAPGCASSFGALDITSREIAITSAESGLEDIGNELIAAGFRERGKTYLIYYDGPTGQTGRDRICGVGAAASRGLPGYALVYIEPCGGETDDDVRVTTAAHELIHSLGAVSSAAPNECPKLEEGAHVCDNPLDVMVPEVTGEPFSGHFLDVNRDDYYGHSGRWTDVQDSTFLERLDGPDRTPPTAPGNVRVSERGDGQAHITWRPSTDDVGPVEYWLYQSGVLVERMRGTTARLLFAGATTQFGVRAVDTAGRLSPIVLVRFRRGVGMVDASGRLVRDTVSPPPVRRVSVRRQHTTVRLSWPAVRDAGGIRGYEINSGGRTFFVRKPAVVLALSRIDGPVTITALDRARNASPPLLVPRSRLR